MTTVAINRRNENKEKNNTKNNELQKMGVKEFVEYSIDGPGRGAFYKREEKAAKKRNGPTGPKELWRVSSYRHTDRKHEIAMLMGKSERDLIVSWYRETVAAD